jgi:hypothetical protein
MSGVSPGGVAENGTRSGNESCDLGFMRLVFSNLLPCLPSLAVGLVPAGHRYYEGSDSSAKRITGLHAAEVSLLISIELPGIPSPATLLPFRDARFISLRFLSPSPPPHDPCGLSRHPELGHVVDPCAVRGSRIARTLPDRLGRIEFTFVTDCSFDP